MEILSGIIFVFLLIQLTVAISNARIPIPRTPAKVTDSPSLSILIPARNEEKNLPCLLQDLLQQEIPPLEILVCDDHSSDRTYLEASCLAAIHPVIRVFKGEKLPPGWLGKNFVCEQLAHKARGNYLLFLDADVRIGAKAIAPILSEAIRLKTGLLSVFPRQSMLSPGEKSTVPLMTYILLTLLPLSLVYKIAGQSALAAANGQFMMFEATAYRQVQPHRVKRHEAVEDIAIARLYKKSGYRVACLTGLPDVSCRMYTGHREAIRGFARSIAGFFGGSLVLAFLFWLLTCWGWLPVLVAFSWPGLILYLGLRSVVRLLVARKACQSPAVNLRWSIPQQYNFAFILLKALQSRISKKMIWKDRNILNPQ